jgi:hypothetical protein
MSEEELKDLVKLKTIRSDKESAIATIEYLRADESERESLESFAEKVGRNPNDIKEVNRFNKLFQLYIFSTFPVGRKGSVEV